VPCVPNVASFSGLSIFLLPLGCFLMFICTSSLCCYFLWMCLTRRESVQVLYCLLGQCRFKTWKEGWNLYLNSDDIFVLDLDFQQYLSSCFYCVVGCQLLLFLTFSYYSLIIFHSDLGAIVQSVPTTTKVVSVQIPLMARCTWYNIMWWSLSVTCGRSVIFYMYSVFLHQ
jgi:hypothetical protein